MIIKCCSRFFKPIIEFNKSFKKTFLFRFNSRQEHSLQLLANHFDLPLNQPILSSDLTLSIIPREEVAILSYNFLCMQTLLQTTR